MEIKGFAHKEAVDKIVNNIETSRDLIETAINMDIQTFEDGQAYVNTWKLYDQLMSMATVLRAKFYEVTEFIIKNIANGTIEVVDNGYDDVKEIMQSVIEHRPDYTVHPVCLTTDDCVAFAIYSKCNDEGVCYMYRLELSNDLTKVICFESRQLVSG